MINNSAIRNCTTSAPPISITADQTVAGRVELRELFPEWNGQCVEDLCSPRLRVGSPVLDKQLQQDPVYLIADYLCASSFGGQLEKRYLVQQRMMQGLRVGQSIDENEYKNSLLHVAGEAVVQDIVIKQPTGDLSVGLQLRKMASMIQQLQKELRELKTEMTIKNYQ